MSQGKRIKNPKDITADLKAENDALKRQLAIEAALEKVRERTMKMRSSNELPEVALILWEQLERLDLKGLDGCAIHVNDDETDTFEGWSAFPDLIDGARKMKLDRNRHNQRCIWVWKEWDKHYRAGETSFSVTCNKKQLNQLIDWFAPFLPGLADEMRSLNLKELYVNGVAFSNGILGSSSVEPLSEETWSVFKRLGSVFDQAYRRFLDLKKAEEQAREAQIEAALERVRSRTMGMQRSEELQDAAMLLFQQVEVLGLPVFACGFNIWDNDRKYATAWMAGKDRLQPPFKTSSGEDIFKRINKAAQRGESLFVEEQGGDALKTHYEYMTSIPVFKEIVNKMAATGQSFPTFQVVHCAYFSQGYLMFISFGPVPEAHDIFKRFAKVFEQTYTRFLDLKKAEKQTREAQIEAALERVRARAMAMHKSEELKEVIAILYHELTGLGLDLYDANIVIQDKDSKSLTFWGSGLGGVNMPPKFTIPYLEHEVIKKVYFHGFQGKSYVCHELKGKEFQNALKIIITETEFKDAPKEYLEEMLSAKRLFLTHVAIGHGFLEVASSQALSNDNLAVLQRFGSVVDLTYTRFDDVVQAEYQAREAQIEATLERVRNRTLLMRDSSELNEAVAVFFQQFQTLGLLPDETRTYFCHIDPNADVAEVWMTRADGTVMSGSHHTPLTKSASMSRYYEAWKKGESIMERNYTGKALKDYLAFVSTLPHVKKDRDYQKIFHSPPKRIVMTDANFLQGNIGIMTFQPLSQNAKDMLIRFAKVFEFTYTRFLDLKKAEEQAREAQIEAALERVRAKAMAMHSSEDLVQTVGQLFKELNSLDISLLRCGVGRVHKDTRVLELYTFSTSMGDPLPVIGNAVLKGHPVLNGCFRHWEKQEEYHPVLKGASLKKYYEQIKANYKLPGNQDSKVQYGYFFPFRVGVLFTYTETIFSEEELSIFRKFSSVVGLTYRRFLDLKEAEEQAREAQIEVALERIRARAMAMHNSDELMEVADVMREQMSLLGQPQLQTAAIHIYPDEGDDFESWFSLHPKGKSDKIITMTVTFKKEETKLAREMLARYRSEDQEYTMHVRGKPLEEWRQMAKVRNPTLIRYWGDDAPGHLYWHFTDFSGGSFVMVSRQPPTEESKALQRRVSVAFDLAYRRFLDLKKAEAQTREAQIEAALERVRAAALAMHASEDLFSVAEVLHDQLAALGQKELESSIIHIYPDDLPTFDAWYSYRATDDSSLRVSDKAIVRKNACSWTKKVMDLYRSNEKSYMIESKGKMLRDWYQVLGEVAPATIDREKSGEIIVPKVLFYHFSRFSGGALLMISNEPPTEEARDMQLRAANVFDLAYRRFLDLQKAETQAREAQIEAALERVRASTMAMHSSDDVGKATTLLFQELENLGIETMRCGIAIISEDQTMEAWASSTFDGDVVFNVAGRIDMTIHPLLKQLFKEWKSGAKVFSYELKGRDAERYYSAIRKLPSYRLPDINNIRQKHYCTGFLFKEGVLFAFSKGRFMEEQTQIFQKFTNVFTLTYRRYLDLKEAEARASAAVLKSALDRVRAEIASMRTKEDLQLITPLVWRELRSLGVPFFRCGVFIMDESTKTVHMYLSTPTGEPLATVNLGFDEKEIPLVRAAIDHWKAQTVHKTHWNRQQFKKFTESLKKRGLIKSLKAYQQGEKPPESLNLHQVPFRQGMLYVGSSEPLEDDRIELIHSLADAFSVAYARYEDFVQLEEAKQSVENTLVELRSAQDQLIHAEKMASLGELTAGIAHEIQNPLNFVNNFSEVSGELITELKEEIEAGNLEEALEIGQDLIQNIEKINHHGKRASSIVKGMLQHSRSGSDQKAPTDINYLADEYLRLAYHGFRAKDKSFNVSFKTDLADDLPKINVVPQDIGRVLLNLINNAFQAVRGVESPEVMVKTRMKDRMVVISVIDNGPGIPDDIKDKIFQPFFTTKPAGEGTGLGLSLSYDIVTKGHGGTLSVLTPAGGKSGAEFVIYLPT